MFGPGVNFQLGELGAAEAVVRDHATDGKLDQQFGPAGLALLESFAFVAADVTGKTGVDFRLCLLAGHAHLGSIDHHDEVAGVTMRSVDGFVFAAQDVGNFRRDAPEDFVLSIDNPPAALDFFGFGGKGFHHKIDRKEYEPGGRVSKAFRYLLDPPSERGNGHRVQKGGNHTVGHSWDEVFQPDGTPREIYRPVLDLVFSLPKGETRLIIAWLEATMREMGVTFDLARESPWGRRPWFCDVLPALFGGGEWGQVAAGLRQRLKAFELFLADVHGEKTILRAQVIPARVVLGSPFFQRPAVGLPRPGGAFLHLSGLAMVRRADGRLAVAHHYFSNASGISYMMQNRRALSRVFAEAFQNHHPQSIADVPVSILEAFRALAPRGVAEPVVALLTPGAGSRAHSEHGFLARRMGLPLVQGGDLLVLDDRLYLKSVAGLERIDVLYTRVADAWLDSMVFRRDSLLGVAGLAQCVRQGTVAVANAMGSQLADDRALLQFSARIIRFYLGEEEILPTLPTWWLGDLDQRDHVVGNLEDYEIRPLYGEPLTRHAESTKADTVKLLRLLRDEPQNYVAQPGESRAVTVCLDRRGGLEDRCQDHLVFALRGAGGDYEVFPGALTRVSSAESNFTASELGGGSKDTWVLASDQEVGPRPLVSHRAVEVHAPQAQVTSRVADSFYWLGRYLERAQNLSTMVGVVESLETEELNRAERQLYRPVWNRVLPPLENGETGPKRGLSSALERYHLVLDGREEGSVCSILRRALGNAGQIAECLSVEAFGVLSKLEGRFARARFRPDADQASLALATQRFSAAATSGIAEFFGLAEATMLADRGWNFCLLGQQFERAAVTANAGLTIFKSIARRREKTPDSSGHALEIELSAFLRLLGSRDAYRRVYQMRAEPVPVLRLLYDHPEMPRSVRRCLGRCAHLLGAKDDHSPGMVRTRDALEAIEEVVAAADWSTYFLPATTASGQTGGGVQLDAVRLGPLVALLTEITERTYAVHGVIADGFINHQILLD